MAFLRSMKRLLDRVRDERGAISVLVALGMTVFLGIAALAIDLGHMLNVRTESQRVADLAALAAAAVFINPPATPTSTVQTAKAWALQFAQMNDVNQQPVVAPAITDGDIVVDLTQEKVRVTVHHSQARGNAIPTIFARVLGIFDVDVVTTAVAQAFPAGGVTCVLPFFLADKWKELGGDPNKFDPGTDEYVPFDPTNPSAYHTGYDNNDIGTTIQLNPAPGNSPSKPNPSWYFPFDAEDIPGGANLRSSISGCGDPSFTYAIGQLLWVENGAMPGPIGQGFNDLIAQDPSAQWDPVEGCVVTSLGGPCRSSPRLRPVAMMAPYDAPPAGKNQVPISNFAGLFVESVTGNQVNVVFTGYSGVNPLIGGPAPNTSNIKFIRLIE